MRPRRPDIPPYVPIDSRLQLSKNKFLDNGSLEPLEEHTDLAYQANNGGTVSSFRHVDVLPGPSGTLSKGLRSYRSTRSSTRLVEVSQDGGESLCIGVGGLGVGNGSAERLFQPQTVYDGGGREAGLAGASDRAFPQSVYVSGGNPDRIFSLASGASDRIFPSLHGSGAFERSYGQSLHGGGSSGGSSDRAFSSLEWSSAGSISSAREQQPFIGQTLSPSQASVAAMAGGVETVRPSQQAYKAGGLWPDFTLSTSGDNALISVDKEFSSGSFTESLLSIDLALRLVASAELMEEPFLISRSKDNRLVTGAVQCSASATALRFWVNGSLGYSDKIQDGFYHIWGMNPHIWEICNDTKEGGRLPSLDMLRKVDPSNTSIEVVLFDKHTDPHLRELENRARTLANKVSSMNELAESLGKLVCSLMGGAAPFEDGELVSRWKASSNLLKDCFSCLVIPVGSLSVGLCRHRALLYKALADWVDLPCRIVRGCKYCGLADGASCLVLSGPEREWLVDLIAKPGDLGDAESLLKSLQATSISSPLRLPDLNVSVMASVQTRAELELSMQVPGLTRFGSNDKRSVRDMLGRSNAPDTARLRNIWPIIPPSEGECKSSSVKLSRPDHKLGYERLTHEGRNFSFVSDAAVVAEKHDSALVKQERLTSSREVTLQSGASPIQTVIQAQNNLDRGDPSFQSKNKLMVQNSNEVESQQGKAKKPQSLDLVLSLDGFEIPWEELVLRERIGAGSFGTVHRADWHGSDVAVKILIEQDFQEERLEEFVREVALMKRMRHPNVVLFMGAVTKRPNFSIVTEYLPRGSLFRLLHRAGVKEMLDEKRRIRMALDVARGMNYLHRLNPPIVHRDLKSPNLLVDKTWTVKVCDFGLSRFKGNTFLSSKSAAGTPEWMAPEVLRDEPSNEKSDIYSYGVILWELVTLQQPWNGLSPAQVVGAVGFQNRRLQIPKNVNPEIGALIEACFSDDPRQRPSFASIMESLKIITRLSAAAA